MKKNIERIAVAAEASDMINEGEAAELLGMTRRALQNNVYAGKLEGTYTTGIGGRRFYKKSSLIGLTQKPL